MGGHSSLRGTIFTSEYCPGGTLFTGDTIHSDNGIPDGTSWEILNPLRAPSTARADRFRKVNRRLIA